MTAAELGGDIRSALIRDGQVDASASRALYDRASALSAVAIRRLEIPSVLAE